MTSKRTTRKSTRTKAAAEISPVLRTISVDESIDILHALDTNHHVIPTAGRDAITTTIDTLRTAAERLDLGNAYDLATQASTVLTVATSVDKLTAYHRTDVAEPLHRTRNVLASVLAAAATGCNAHPSVIADKLPTLQARSRHASRPAEHDEILICRLDMLATAETGADGQRAAGVYVLCDSGGLPGETTTIALDSFDDPEQVPNVLLPGNAVVEPRIPDIDDYGRPILRKLTAAAIEQQLDVRAPLTYKPRKNAPGSARATASPQGIVDRLLKRWGLFKDDITAYSIPLWRVATVFQTQGLDAAREISGRSAAATLRLINHQPIAEPTFTPHVVSFNTL